MAPVRVGRIDPVGWPGDQPGSCAAHSHRWNVHRHGVTPPRRRPRRVSCRRSRDLAATDTLVACRARCGNRRDRLVRASIVCAAHSCRSCLARRLRHAGAGGHRFQRLGQHAFVNNFTNVESAAGARRIRSRIRAGRGWCRAAATRHRTSMASVHRRPGNPRRSRFGLCRCSR